MEELQVRPFEKNDAEKAADILVNAFRSFLGDKFSETLSECFNADGLIAEAEHKNKLNESALFVADADNKVIGIIKVTAGTNGLGVLDYIGVDPEYHAHGTGSRLMQRAEEFWREHKQRKITTCVSAHNKKALLYYIKNDFVPEGYCKDHFHPGIDEIILGRFMKY